MVFGAVNKNDTWTLLNIPQYLVTPELSMFAMCNIVKNPKSWQNAPPPQKKKKKGEKLFPAVASVKSN